MVGRIATAILLQMETFRALRTNTQEQYFATRGGCGTINQAINVSLFGYSFTMLLQVWSKVVEHRHRRSNIVYAPTLVTVQRRRASTSAE